MTDSGYNKCTTNEYASYQQCPFENYETPYYYPREPYRTPSLEENRLDDTLIKFTEMTMSQNKEFQQQMQ
jgi:hypothetical protein